MKGPLKGIEGAGCIFTKKFIKNNKKVLDIAGTFFFKRKRWMAKKEKKKRFFLKRIICI